MQDTPRANRLHIGIFGKRNAGKSSIINALTGQNISLVSDTLGTTTDPVYKAMELLPLGPVVFIDTAGIDDIGDLGELRVKKTLEVLDKTDVALIVLDSKAKLKSTETELIEKIKAKKLPYILVYNKSEGMDSSVVTEDDKLFVSAKENINIDKLKRKLIDIVPQEFLSYSLLGDVVERKQKVLLVMPQDIQAPKGRLILPQVQIIRDLLDNKCIVVSVTFDELQEALELTNYDLIITDSQKFDEIKDIVPEDVALTSFSIIMAREKGDLLPMYEGAKAISKLQDGSKVLICEACTHHALKGDIAREKLPNWLRKYTGKNLTIDSKSGVDFTEELEQYDLVIHCGACMFNKKQLLNRIYKASDINVPITNFGLAIAYMNGILERAVKPFKM